jgi:hypothetical protein
VIPPRPEGFGPERASLSLLTQGAAYARLNERVRPGGREGAPAGAPGGKGKEDKRMLFNRRSFLGTAALLSIVASLAPAQQAPETLIDLTATVARVFVAPPGQALAPASTGGHAATVGAFLRGQGRPQSAIDSLFLESEHRSPVTGVTHYRFQQRLQGLDVYGTYVKAALNGRGELIHLIDLLVNPPGQLIRPTVTAEGALNAVARHLYPAQSFTFRQIGASGNTNEFTSGDNFFHRNPRVTRIAVPLANGVMQEGYLIETWTQHRQPAASFRCIRIGARPAVRSCAQRMRVIYVYPEHPNSGAHRRRSAGPDSWQIPDSPAGWISSPRTDRWQPVPVPDVR